MRWFKTLKSVSSVSPFGFRELRIRFKALASVTQETNGKDRIAVPAVKGASNATKLVGNNHN